VNLRVLAALIYGASLRETSIWILKLVSRKDAKIRQDAKVADKGPMELIARSNVKGTSKKNSSCNILKLVYSLIRAEEN
jgi:hypothetical protein